MTFRRFLAPLLLVTALPLTALESPETTYEVFQFPKDQIPRIDGDTSDWNVVPQSYVIHSDRLFGNKVRSVEATVRVGWVKGLNRLYFLYEAEDDYWDFSQPDLHNDTFEVVVDGDASGGPLVDKAQQSIWNEEHLGTAAARPDDRISIEEANWSIHGVHAQNYHIFTPAVGKEWAMAWGSPTWVKDFPWANSVCKFDGKPGDSGKLVLEFWITPFDYAGPEGPERAVESVLRENKIIGLGWIIIDYDDPAKRGNSGFWSLSPQRTMFGDASELCAFRLMPLEPAVRPGLDADWSWQIIDHANRQVAFTDQSVGEVTTWSWDFGDGQTSTEKSPIHTYEKVGSYVVILRVEGPAGTDQHAKIWDIQFR